MNLFVFMLIVMQQLVRGVSFLFSPPTDRLPAAGSFSSERREAWGELEEAREGAEPYIVAFGRFSQITVGIAKVS